jgi:hypothetical protein
VRYRSIIKMGDEPMIDPLHSQYIDASVYVVAMTAEKGVLPSPRVLPPHVPDLSLIRSTPPLPTVPPPSSCLVSTLDVFF